MSKRLADCQRVIGHHFSNALLLEIALTHSSVRTPDRECNERQEFLGDSVLGLVITEELYKRLPDQQEGELTRIKSAVVSRGALYRVSLRLGLPRFVEIAKGVGRKDDLPVSLTANLVESIIGAIYLDAGFFPAREFILRHLGPELEDTLNDKVPKNFKSLLQHECQRLLGTTPSYRTIEEDGPDHRKSFTVAAVVRGTEYGRATGVTKKDAEQEAARRALEALARRGRGRSRRRGDEGERERDPRDSRDSRDSRDRGRGEPRGEGRGRRGREGGREAPAPVVQSHDEDSWRSWAEGPVGRPASAPAAEFVLGPEPEEAYLDAPADAPASATAPPPPEAAEEDLAGRRRRPRRRGGRGRGAADAEGAPAPAAASDGAAPAAPEAAEPTPAAAPARRRTGDRAPRDRAPRERKPRAPRGAREGRAPAEGRERPVRERPAAPAATPATSSSAPPPARSPSGRPAFGAGVVADSVAPSPRAPASAERTVTGSLDARKKAPVAPPPRPAGGFGSGLA